MAQAARARTGGGVPGAGLVGRGAQALIGAPLLWLAVAVGAAAEPLLLPFDDAQAWEFSGLPRQTKPRTQFAVVDLDGERALRVEADDSYGNLVHRVSGSAATAHRLKWRWRLDEPVAGADLKTRGTDDAALKVCVLFDEPIERVPFLERQTLRLARATAGEPLPAATLCYVWAPLQAAGTIVPSAFTHRVRWIVLRGQRTPLAKWQEERRDLRADFQAAFGDGSPAVPPILAVAVGADADNTHGHSAGYVAALELLP